MKGFAIVVLVVALGIAHGQTPTEQKPDTTGFTEGSSTGFITQTKMYRTIIYPQPKDGKILMEFFNDKEKLVFTVYIDGTVKAENGADLDKTTKEFWKNFADAFRLWKESACSTQNQ